MAYQLFQLPKPTAISSNLTLLSGAKAYFYEPGTTTPRNTYSDPGLTTPNTNPVVADAAGVFSPIYLDPELEYKVTLKTSADVELYTIDKANDQVLSQAIIGRLLYPRTTAESNAGVTPVNYAYPPGHLYRYASNLATLGDGTGDDTVAWQRMLAFPGRKYVPRPASKYKVDPLEIISNTWIEMEAGTTITANEGYGVDRGVFNLSDGVSNIVIRGNGSTIDMEWTYTTGEDKFCLALWEATNVWVDGMTFRRGVDGIYVGFHPAHSENVWITNFRCELNRRNGISVTSARNAWFVNGVLSENGTTHGTNPKAGIDIEPNGNAGVGSTMDSEIDGIYVVNVKSSGNGNYDFMIAGQNLDTGGKKISVHIIDCEGDSAGDSSLLTDNWLPGASGGVFVRNYIARNAGANSFAQRSSALPVLIDGLLSIDPNQGDQASDHFGAHVAIYGHNTTDGSTYGNVTIRNAFGRGSSARKTVALALVNEPNSIIRDIDIEIDTDAAATKRYGVGGSASNSAGKRRVRFTDLTDIAVTSNIAAASMPAYSWNTVSNSGASSNLTHNLSDPGMRVDGTEIGFRCVAGFNMTLNPGTGWTIGGGALLQTRQPGAYVRVRANATTQSWEVIEGGDGWSPTPISFTSGDDTPSVAAGRIFITANAVPTTISAFDDGTSKEIVVLIGDDNTTIDFTGTTLKGNGGVDWTPANGDMMRCVHDGTNWRCQVIDCTA